MHKLIEYTLFENRELVGIEIRLESMRAESANGNSRESKTAAKRSIVVAVIIVYKSYEINHKRKAYFHPFGYFSCRNLRILLVA